MNALLNPINRKNGGVKWLLVVHTTIMFSLVTTLTVINIYLLFVAYIENREFPGADGVIPGPLGYEDIISSEAPSVATNVILFLNQSLADGLLVSSISRSVPQLSNVGYYYPSSSTVSASFTP